jgi:rare lipoprotein A
VVEKNTDIYYMKRICLVLFVGMLGLGVPRFLAAQTPGGELFRQEGIASWYGPEFDGRPTASGEIFNSSYLTAAHPTLPFGTMLAVTNRHNNKKVTVKVNDRGPFVSARIIDVSKAAAEQLDMLVTGTAPVLIESLDRIAVSSPPRTQAQPAQSPEAYWTLPPQTQQQVPQQVYPQQQAAPVQGYAPSPPPPQVQQPQPMQTQQAYPQQQAAPVQGYAPQAQIVQPAAQAYIPQDQTIAPIPQTAPSPRAPISQQVYAQASLSPAIVPAANKVYRLQVGSYKVARNAVETYEKLKNAGLNPAYERNGEFFRVVLSGVRGNEVQSVTEKLGSAGFREAIIREER